MRDDGGVGAAGDEMREMKLELEMMEMEMEMEMVEVGTKIGIMLTVSTEMELMMRKSILMTGNVLLIVETTLIACDVVEFYRLFFSQSTGFGYSPPGLLIAHCDKSLPCRRQMHKNRGDTDVKISDWNKLNRCLKMS
eukprot:767433-Hanusia_phi.AAC.4